MLLLVHGVVHHIVHEALAAFDGADWNRGIDLRVDLAAGGSFRWVGNKARIERQMPGDDLAFDGPWVISGAVDSHVAAGKRFKLGEILRAQATGRQQRNCRIKS